MISDNVIVPGIKNNLLLKCRSLNSQKYPIAYKCEHYFSYTMKYDIRIFVLGTDLNLP